MTRQRRNFDLSFKLEVVKMIKEQGLSVQHVSESMGIGSTAIRRWVWRSMMPSWLASQASVSH